MKEKLKTFFKSLKNDKTKLAFYILCLCGFVLMIGGSFQAGFSGDEEFHIKHSKAVFDYYRTLGKDSTAITYSDDWNLPRYGQLVDNIAYDISQWFHIKNIVQVRHTVNALCGWLAILFTSLLVFRIAGRKFLPAAITFFLFLFSPRFLGHSFNDMKDVSFLTFMVMGCYYIWVFCEEFPKPKWKTMIMLAVSIGLAMSIRVGGLLLIPYFGLFAFIRFLIFCKTKDGLETLGKGKALGRLLIQGILISIAGYLLCLPLWPYALQAPVKNVFDTLSYMNSFTTGIKQLFEGRLQWSYNLPWYYTPKWIFMTIPVAVIIGAVLELIIGWKKERTLGISFLFFCFAFPVFWIVYTKANVYGGWRHSMFCYPTLVGLAGLGFYSLYEKFSNRWLKYGLGIALPLILMVGPVHHCFANHPYEYVYFNELAGGVKKAYGKYELDYYYHSTREATEWVLKNADISCLEPGEKLNITTWHTASVGYYVNLLDSTHFRTTFSRIYQMGNNDWDYGIFTVTGMNPDWITNKTVFPPVNTVYSIKVDGVPICIVLKREDKNDFYGDRARRQGHAEEAKGYLLKALDYNPHNEQALENLTEIYIQQGKPDSALIYATRWAQNVPSNISALNLLCQAYFSLGDIQSALTAATQMIKRMPDEITGYWFAAHCFLRMNNLQAALNQLQALVKIQSYKPAYELMAQIYAAAGDQNSSQRCRDIAARL